MSLRLIYGRAGSGKRDRIMDEIRSQVLLDPLGPPIILLVPDQMVFQTEYEFVSCKDLNGMMRVQVLSFKRLAWWVMQETGGLTRQYIDRSGIWMMLRKILESKKDELGIYARAVKQYGFVDQVERMLAEFKRFSITASDLPMMMEIARADGDITLEAKLKDLYKIYLPFEETLSGQYMDGTDRLKLLETRIAESSQLRDAEVYIDGFHDFTPQELAVIKELMKKVNRVSVALTMERPKGGQLLETQLFYMMWETSAQLVEEARKENVEIEVPLDLDQLDQRRPQVPSIRHLEMQYDALPPMPFADKSDIQIMTAVNRRAEIEGIAREIIHLTRESKIRYKDVAILVRDQDAYLDLIQNVFSDFDLPIFIDSKRQMLFHPLVEFIRGVLDIHRTNYRYESVFRAIKTELLFHTGQNRKKERENVDFLENFCIANGIKGKARWSNEEYFRYVKIVRGNWDQNRQTDEEREKEQILKDLRFKIVNPLSTLFNKLENAKTVKEMVTELVMFLEATKVSERLAAWRSEAEAKGNLLEAREHEQVWKAVMDLFDQLVEIMGDEELTFDLFVKILESGFEGLEFSFVPAALDQILIADLEHSRFSNIKTAFIVGMNEGAFPKSVKEESMLSTLERERFTSRGVRLNFSARQQTFNDHTVIYLALTLPSDQLYLSAPLSNEEGKALIPSMIIRKIKEMFPTAKERFLHNDPMDGDQEDQSHYITGTPMTFSYLVRSLQFYKKNEFLHDLWWQVYNKYVEEGFEKLGLRARALDSLNYENEAIMLPMQTTTALYGTYMETSISRMEMFYKCPFQHYSKYGLNLKEREEYEIQNHHIGTIYHDCIEAMFEILKGEGVKWRDLSKSQSKRLAQDAVRLVAPKFQREILLSSNRLGYLMKKMERVITQVAWILKEHGSRSDFNPMGMEIPFGRDQKIPELKISLDNGYNLGIRGRIDQVDQAFIQNHSYVRVIDYKSSKKALDWNEVYYGLALQLVTYLDIISTHSKEAVGVESFPAGGMYFHIHQPMIQAKNGIFQYSDLEDTILKDYKMKGILIGGKEVIEKMDVDLIEDGKSKVIPADFKKDGELSAKSSVISLDQFQPIRNFVRNKFEEAGNRIMSGEVRANPVKIKGNIPCTYCNYRSVCQFDRDLQENQYNYLPKLKGEEALKRICEGGNQR